MQITPATLVTCIAGCSRVVVNHRLYRGAATLDAATDSVAGDDSVSDRTGSVCATSHSAPGVAPQPLPVPMADPPLALFREHDDTGPLPKCTVLVP